VVATIAAAAETAVETAAATNYLAW